MVQRNEASEAKRMEEMEQLSNEVESGTALTRSWWEDADSEGDEEETMDVDEKEDENGDVLNELKIPENRQSKSFAWNASEIKENIIYYWRNPHWEDGIWMLHPSQFPSIGMDPIQDGEVKNKAWNQTHGIHVRFEHVQAEIVEAKPEDQSKRIWTLAEKERKKSARLPLNRTTQPWGIGIWGWNNNWGMFDHSEWCWPSCRRRMRMNQNVDPTLKLQQDLNMPMWE